MTTKISKQNLYSFLQTLPIIWLFSGFLFSINSVNFLIPLIILCLITKFFHSESSSTFVPKFYILAISCIVIHLIILYKTHDVSTKEIRGYIISIIMIFVIPFPKITSNKVIALLILASISSFFYTYYYSIHMPTPRASWPLNPIPQATIAAAIASVSLIYAMYSKSSTKLKLLAILSFFLLLTSIFLTQSRGPSLAIVISSIIIAFISIYSKSVSYKIILIIGVAIVVGGYIATPKILERYNQTKSEISVIKTEQYSTSIGIRLDLWKTAYYVIKSNPIHGGGRDLRPYLNEQFNSGKISATTHHFNASHYHNQYLDAWAKNGIVFFLLTLTILIYPIFYYFKNKNIHSLCSLNISIVYCIASLTDVPLHSSSNIIFYIFIQCLLLGAGSTNKKNAL